MNSNYPVERKFLIRGVPKDKVKDVLEYIQRHMGGILVDSVFREQASVKEMVGWIRENEEKVAVAFGVTGRGGIEGPYVSVFAAVVQWPDAKHLELQYSPEIFPQFDWEYNDG